MRFWKKLDIRYLFAMITSPKQICSSLKSADIIARYNSACLHVGIWESSNKERFNSLREAMLADDVTPENVCERANQVVTAEPSEALAFYEYFNQKEKEKARRRERAKLFYNKALDR